MPAGTLLGNAATTRIRSLPCVALAGLPANAPSSPLSCLLSSTPGQDDGFVPNNAGVRWGPQGSTLPLFPTMYASAAFPTLHEHSAAAMELAFAPNKYVLAMHTHAPLCVHTLCMPPSALACGLTPAAVMRRSGHVVVLCTAVGGVLSAGRGRIAARVLNTLPTPFFVGHVYTDYEGATFVWSPPPVPPSLFPSHGPSLGLGFAGTYHACSQLCLRCAQAPRLTCSSPSSPPLFPTLPLLPPWFPGRWCTAYACTRIHPSSFACGLDDGLDGAVRGSSWSCSAASPACPLLSPCVGISPYSLQLPSRNFELCYE